MSTFFAMGGFAWFVWPCYALTALSMGWLALQAWRARSNKRAELARLSGHKD